MLRQDGQGQPFELLTYEADPSNDFALTPASTATIAVGAFPFDPANAFVPALAAGDTQGRSLLLGAPTKATISHHAQPEVVLGMPPMHVVAVPKGKKSHKERRKAFEILNLSAVLHGYSAQYDTSVTNQTQSSAACPDAMATCAADERVPAYVLFSGPDMVSHPEVDGANVEWYQPLHEAGNALSHPWEASQLMAEYDGFSPLTAIPPNLFYTDSSTQKQSATWTEGGGSSQSAGSSTTHSFQKSESVSATVVFDNLGEGFKWGYNTSKSGSTLNTTVDMVGESTGIGINKPGTFANPPAYQFPVGALIFGQDDPAGTVDEITLDTELRTTGALRTRFLADPTDPNAGTWWKATYTLPDVAVNHPVRWNVQAQVSSQPSANCLVFDPASSAVDCATFNNPDTDDIPTSEFHRMKGFFVTPRDANGEGPQRTSVTASDGLFVETRVYNLSLVDMPAGTTVHVRFYGQQFDNTTGMFAAGTESFLVDEVTLGPIPGFRTSDDANWVTASTTLDTSTYADQYLVFWVVVWMQDANGDLVDEMPGHGLEDVPDVDTAIGDQPIYIAPAATPATLATTGAATDEPTVTHLRASPKRPRPTKKVTVEATIQNGPAQHEHLRVHFYGRGPEGTLRLFDVEHIPHLRAGDTFVARVPYRPSPCGRHTIFAVLDGQALSPAPSAELRVKCGRGHEPALPGRFRADRRDCECRSRRPSWPARYLDLDSGGVVFGATLEEEESFSMSRNSRSSLARACGCAIASRGVNPPRADRFIGP